MTRLEQIKQIEDRIIETKKQLKELDELYLKAFSPKGYKGGTSYNDYDTIPGGNKEYHLDQYCLQKNKLETLLMIDRNILSNLKRDINVDETLKLLSNNTLKVKFLRIVAGYTQKETAEKLGISESSVYRMAKSE
ncbi:ECF-type sigma factor family protein [Clostridium culturomicium]|uniref:transcriptional regulator n=1 Tax=Clostridium culturomicium TaxID=1499683 RepID=UPI0005912657|nr:transcriptional regulator [Clostridium culturomicium]